MNHKIQKLTSRSHVLNNLLINLKFYKLTKRTQVVKNLAVNLKKLINLKKIKDQWKKMNTNQ